MYDILFLTGLLYFFENTECKLLRIYTANIIIMIWQIDHEEFCQLMNKLYEGRLSRSLFSSHVWTLPMGRHLSVSV